MSITSMEAVQEFQKEPPFVPRPGQIDFTNIRRAPVISCVIVHAGKVLLVQRSAAMRLYPNGWSGVSGFLDEPAKTVADKAFEELEEEIGVAQQDVLSLKEGLVFEEEDDAHNKTWIVHPVLVELGADTVTLGWESQAYAWVEPAAVHEYDILPSFKKVLERFSLN